MLTNVTELTALIISLIACVIILIVIKLKIAKSQMKTAWIFVYTCMIIMCIGTIAQITLSKLLNIDPIYFEYFTYIGNSFLSVAFLFAAMIFANTKITFKKRYILLFCIPIISLLVLWTNDIHHLFYINYSIFASKTTYGPFLYIYNAYTLLLLAISIIYLLQYSIKNSGIFSKQAIMVIIAAIIPISINVLSIFKILEFTIYITPISFAITIILLTFAIFKFKFLNIVPIALQKIVDKISDGYLVLNEENLVTDFNRSLLTTFNIKSIDIRNKNIFELIEEYQINKETIKMALENVKKSDTTETFEKKIDKIKKYFTIEINAIRQKEQFLGTLILLKDITQHKEDMIIIKRNQDMLVEKERLSTLGQMIGGIAHNLKTPIMSISGATEALSDLIQEYNLSIDNPQVNSEDHHGIAKDMSLWIEKIKNYLEYMSDVITAVKGQAVNFSEEQDGTFTVSELVKYVTILMKHELNSAIVYLNTEINCDEKLELQGNLNSLVQVIDNMISNAIQAYNGEPKKTIDMIINKEKNKIIISIKDYGPGLPEEVKEKLFKEMVTTKGKNGTGLGLYMSYSNIKAHFQGDISVETEKGKGTTFNIILPMNE